MGTVEKWEDQELDTDPPGKDPSVWLLKVDTNLLAHNQSVKKSLSLHFSTLKICGLQSSDSDILKAQFGNMSDAEENGAELCCFFKVYL